MSAITAAQLLVGRGTINHIWPSVGNYLPKDHGDNETSGKIFCELKSSVYFDRFESQLVQH